MAITIPSPYTQYTGIWKLNSASAAVGAGTWAVPPTPKLYAWGYNGYGALGLGNTVNRSSPNQVGSDTNWLQVCAGGYGNTSAAIKTNGTLWAWGYNNSGQLGIGNTTNYSSPKQIGALTGWLQVSTGRYRNTAAIKTNGTLWTWGNNSLGALGLGNTTSYSSPKQVGSGTNWAMAACGNSTTIAIKTDGTLWSWGYNPQGQLGLGITSYFTSLPQQVGTLTNWSKVSSVGNFCVAIKTDGTLWSWGYNVRGQLGLGDTTSRSSPVQVGALTNWLTVATGYSSCLAIKTDGTLWSWGFNFYGQLGLGDTTNRSSPVQVGALTTWLYIAATYNSSYSIKTNGTLWSWGDNGNGQLGLGNTTYYSSPKQVGALTTWTTLSTFGGNAYHMLAIALN